MGKDWGLPLSFPPGEKEGTFLGPGGSPCSPGSRGQGSPLSPRPGDALRAVSAGVGALCAHACAARAESPWCRIPPCSSLSQGVPQMKRRDGVGNLSLGGVQLPGEKAVS